MRAAAVRCHLRPMEPADIAQVLDIERQSFPSMWPQTVYQRELKNKMARYLVACEPRPPYFEEPRASSMPEERRIGKLVRQFLGGLPAAEPRERILGVVGLWCVVGEGHIVTIAVRQDCRRQGIGEVLLLAALKAAREAGQDTVTLEYRISNVGARALYEKYGFRQVGVRTRYYSDNQEDAVLMTTPPLRSSPFQRLTARRIAELEERWGADYPLGFREL